MTGVAGGTRDAYPLGETDLILAVSADTAAVFAFYIDGPTWYGLRILYTFSLHELNFSFLTSYQSWEKPLK